MEKPYEFYYTTQWEGIQIDAFLNLNLWDSHPILSDNTSCLLFRSKKPGTPLTRNAHQCMHFMNTEEFTNQWRNSLEDLTEAYLKEAASKLCKNTEETPVAKQIKKAQLRLF